MIQWFNLISCSMTTFTSLFYKHFFFSFVRGSVCFLRILPRLFENELSLLKQKRLHRHTHTICVSTYMLTGNYWTICLLLITHFIKILPGNALPRNNSKLFNSIKNGVSIFHVTMSNKSNELITPISLETLLLKLFLVILLLFFII